MYRYITIHNISFTSKMNNKYTLEIQLLSTSSSTSSTLQNHALSESALNLNQHCQALLHDHLCSKYVKCNKNCTIPSYDDTAINCHFPEPFVSYVDCVKLLYRVDEGEEEKSNETKCKNSDHDECSCPPLLAITIPIDILDHIEYPSTKSNSMSMILSNALTKIHPSLTYLEPCGLLRSIPQSRNDKMRSQSGLSSSVVRNSFDIILLKLNNFLNNEEESRRTSGENNGSHGGKINNSSNFVDGGKYEKEDIDEKDVGEESLNTTSQNNNYRRRETIIEMNQTLVRIMEEVNGETMEISPTSVIQALPISNLSFSCKLHDDGDSSSDVSGEASAYNVVQNGECNEQASKQLNQAQHVQNTYNEGQKQHNSSDILSEIPLCPVCRFRIEPRRLGFHDLPKSYQKCSNSQITRNGITATEGDGSANMITDHVHSFGYCKNMQFLSPWTYPSYCEACHILGERLAVSGAQPFLINSSSPTISQNNKLLCYKCGMKETLWVCLSCGVVGCGRYSHGHAEKHYKESSHPFSLELATQRIWDYATSCFVNRDDLLNCKYMQQILGAVNRAAYQQGASVLCSNIGSFDEYGIDVMAPKKTSVIGEEYEALLQSALEDQAQHFDLEISHLKAQLASETTDIRKMSSEQMIEVADLEKEISELRTEVEVLSREYVEVQAQEAGHRAKSKCLLREQGVTKQLLDKVREEESREHRDGKQIIEELEQQVRLFKMFSCYHFAYCPAEQQVHLTMHIF